MKTKKQITLYNFLTVAFAVLTLGSVGTLATGTPLVLCAIVTGTFAYATLYCYRTENTLRAKYRRHKKALAKRATLSVYNGKKSQKAVVA